MREKEEDQGKFQISKKSKSFYLAGLILALIFVVIAWKAKVQSTPEMASPTKLSEVVLTDAGQIHKDDLARNHKLYGYATISPAGDVVAGSWGTWTLTYWVGRLGVDDGGQILILTQAACDWGPFQMDNPKEVNYITVHTTGQARLVARFEPRYANPRPWWRGIVITVKDGYLKYGDQVIVILGDRSGDGLGSRAQTISQEKFEFRVMVDPFATVKPVRVLASPRLRIVSGKAAKLEALWPTETLTEEPTWLLVRSKDFWGNPASFYRGTIRFNPSKEVTGLPKSYTFTAADQGFHRFEGLRVGKAGICRIRIKDEAHSELAAETNPLVALSNLDVRPFWGDFHGQSGETGGLGTVDSYFAYARGFAGADFASWAGNDLHITAKEWKAVQEATKKYNQPGRFVTYLGYEWSGNTGNGGDHNVIYLEDDQPIYRSSYAEVEDPYDPDTDKHTVRDLASTMPLGKVLLLPHIGGRRANLDFYQTKLMPLIEIYSGHGQFEWFLKEALRRKLKVGFVANSDDVYGRPAESIPGVGLFAVHGGLTCVYAHGLNRENLWEALYKRRVYATTGERIRLRFQANDHWMGEEILTNAPVSFSVEAAGTAGIERVDLFRGLERVYRYLGNSTGCLSRIKIVWSGARSRQRARQTVWDGKLVLSEGRFLEVQPYRFDYPSEGIERWDEHRVIWRSFTSGDEDGLILYVEAPENAVLTFEANMVSRDQFGLGAGKEIANFSVPLRKLSGEDWVYLAGGLDRQVLLRRVAETYPREIRFTWMEKELPSGTSAYWVRLLQQDGAVAWSSPIFVTRLSKN